MEMMMVVAMVMMLRGRQGGAGKHHQQQDGGKNLFHGKNLARPRRRWKRFGPSASKEETGPSPSLRLARQRDRNTQSATPARRPATLAAALPARVN